MLPGHNITNHHTASNVRSKKTKKIVYCSCRARVSSGPRPASTDASAHARPCAGFLRDHFFMGHDLSMAEYDSHTYIGRKCIGHTYSAHGSISHNCMATFGCFFSTAEYDSHKYLGNAYKGHTHMGHDYTGPNCIGHDPASHGRAITRTVAILHRARDQATSLIVADHAAITT